MPPLDEHENGDLQFHWGKRGASNLKKDVHFYESFTYDKESYSLYDNVYLFKQGADEPYIGKILKIWELPDRKRRVKILWFFRPSDVHAFLDGHTPSEKEIFLASGEGVGLSNVNPLEAIAGKCCVICTSEDVRNPKPSSIAKEKADFIFSRIFDVGSCKILEALPEAIAGVEVRLLLNRAEDQISDLPPNFEAVGTGAFDEIPVKKLRPSNSLVEFSLDSQGKPLSGTKKLINGSDEELPDNEIYKRLLPRDGYVKQANDDSKDGPSIRKVKLISDEENSDNDLVQESKGSSAVVELAEEKFLSQQPTSSASHRYKWFADMPWKTRVEKADKQGKLVFLYNLDPLYSSSEIEETLHTALQVDCIVKVIPQVSFHNLHYGQAYAIFKSQSEAVRAVQEMDKKRLILSDGRPVCAKLGMLELPRNTNKFSGHLKIDRSRIQTLRLEHKKALSTSHCSQPNTIEYEMALDWLLLQEKYRRSWKRLLKNQGDQMKTFMSRYKPK
ncbi:DNA (cytosine-5-)-methyltransferase [Apostasia shenzhenica]|uniref:DNA (Cytosine-5-)-methyltransferase n=1 Tax=Apostasia shenzhenica TaxID=1088818 RepID=A0A2I0A7W1_9ASPA|nr:DNA (cytosine-5-)-methyltransferase [Apostasia shenzhenica]